jgi:DNA-binding response OmpR family regulator
MIRRAGAGRLPGEFFRVGEVDVDLRHQRAQKGHRVMPLSSLECEVLRYLTARMGQVVSRDQLLRDVWGYQTFCTTRSVDNLVGRLRQKIEIDPRMPSHILTVHGTGYRFVA